MTPLQIVLAVMGLAIALGLGAAVVWSVHGLLTGHQTVSGYMDDAPRWVVFAAGFGIGGAVCGLAAHWWWPTVGNP